MEGASPEVLTVQTPQEGQIHVVVVHLASERVYAKALSGHPVDHRGVERVVPSNSLPHHRNRTNSGPGRPGATFAEANHAQSIAEAAVSNKQVPKDGRVGNGRDSERILLSAGSIRSRATIGLADSGHARKSGTTGGIRLAPDKLAGTRLGTNY
ncbi:hypothetical protein EAI_04419 [Harpegnathos saltator]|uniref:Uncharacterized protein n=1 Tax=Harpegnathos saltator TaxID=610380 RepID=E2BBG3_HARSA|nr:hypothetical protein EAI_04419 [Harpegnathos saltator]